MNVSVILPAYYEEENIQFIYEQISGLDLHEIELLEMIFVDDGSRDGTFDEVKKLAKMDSRVSGICF